MTNESDKAREPTAPASTTVKRLFALSGNQCAFPKCSAAIVDGKTVVGEVCHIKAAKPGGPRYDRTQTATERHSYENLILLCGTHHTVIDADEEAYTVGRILKMKNEHERREPSMSDESASLGAALLIDNSVKSLNQSGGITAQTVTIHNYPQTSEPTRAPASPTGFVSVEPKNGHARFRVPDQPLGVRWDSPSYSDRADQEIFLSAGAAAWLRVIPKSEQNRNWSAKELRDCATKGGNVTLQPFLWTSLNYLRAEDGFGTYAPTGVIEPQPTETSSVAFAFETGEVWSIDTSMLNSNIEKLFFLEIAQAFLKGLHNYGLFLRNLGHEPPFDWVAGLERVKGRRLEFPSPHGAAFGFAGSTCLSDTVSAKGTFDMKDTPGVALRPFFNQIIRKCDAECPKFVTEFIEKWSS
jgi:hypothetical protein